MENNYDKANRYIELTMLHIKKKNFKTAWKFSVKANKLYPSLESKRLMKKLKALKKYSKREARKKRKRTEADTSYGGDSSSSSSSNCNKQKKTKKFKQSYKSSTTYSYSMSVMNKDESYKCLEKAEKYIQDKQFDLAKLFILKSEKLFYLPKANELLKKIQEIQEINKPNYTKEQANIIKKIKNSENYYKMLDIKITATVPEIKKAYRKLALLLHPDKNSAPGSGEVFVVVGNAVETLCDHSKRKTYDNTLMKPTTSTTKSNSQPSYTNQQSESYNVFEHDDSECYKCWEHESTNIPFDNSDDYVYDYGYNYDYVYNYDYGSENDYGYDYDFGYDS